MRKAAESNLPGGVSPGEEETLDRLAGGWRILQLRRGHRFSTDDLLCAWVGAWAQPGALRLLDLGAGIGSVGLLCLWRMEPQARLVMVEVQRISHELALRTVALNGLQERVQARLGDLRDSSMVPERGTYDLVTCSPPYIPKGRGVISPVPQRAGARVELRGDVFDYLVAARRALAPGGRIALVFAAADPRPGSAIEQVGLVLCRRQPVRFRAGRSDALALYVCAHPDDGPVQTRCDPVLVLRDEQGRWTERYRQIRRETGHLA